jgi:hypothetical protein
MRYQPYKFWSRSELGQHLKFVASRLDMGTEVKELIRIAIGDPRWNPLRDYNGCTLVEDLYHPCVSCFLHDYLWLTGQGGKDADYLFYKVMLLEKTPKAKANRRWFAVRAAWLIYFKWKYFSQRNVNEYSDEFLRVLDKFRKEDVRGEVNKNGHIR